MNICVTDKHVGCQLWHASLLRKLGHEVSVRSFSSHSKYLGNAQAPGIFSKIERKGWQALKPVEIEECLQHDTIVCGFPPCFYENFKGIPFKYPIIVNCAHRLHIHCVKDSGFPARMLEDQQAGRIIIGSMAGYETEYIRHYLGITPIELHASCFYLPKDQAYAPTREEILIGPAHARSLYPFKNVAAINKLAGASGLRFAGIRELYSEYTYQDLVQHPAIVIFPYSAYSMSMIECYEMNIPMFVPSPRLLLSGQLLDDVSLYPFYATKRQMRKADTPHPNSPHAHSPNSYEYVDREYWLQFHYCFQKRNIITWDSPEDLLYKIRHTNLAQVSQRMREENAQADAEHLQAWSKLIASLPKRPSP